MVHCPFHSVAVIYKSSPLQWDLIALQLLLACIFQFAFLSNGCSNSSLLFWIYVHVLCFSESIESFLRKTKECIILTRMLLNTCTIKAMPRSRVRCAPFLSGPFSHSLPCTSTEKVRLLNRMYLLRKWTSLQKISDTTLYMTGVGKLEPCFSVKAFHKISYSTQF